MKSFRYFKKYLFLILIAFLFLSIHHSVFAEELPNNKVGIHLAQPSDEDIDRADELINSSGGVWGYVTIVIHEDDLSRDKWQPIFDKLRERRLIPIIRLATRANGESWERPHSKDAEEWVSFLNSLNWVVRNRYIILFNEPNHGTEWGGEVDTQSFGEVNEAFARKLKAASTDFFIMMGGMDVSAPQQKPRYMDASVFLRETIEEIGVEDFNTYFDGLSSHSYPNPGFVGSVRGVGRGSIRTYVWELSLLKNMGIKDLPVFITETGWNGDVLSREAIAENFLYAYQSVWLPDERVVAVTPFILNYQGEPFFKFSWVKRDNVGVYPEFGKIQTLTKEEGRPDIFESGGVEFHLPHDIVEYSTYHSQIQITNKGQGIWSNENGYSLILEGIPQTQYLISSLGTVKPFESRTLDVYFSTEAAVGSSETRFILNRHDVPVLKSQVWRYDVVPLPSLQISVSLLPKLKTSDTGFELQVFDEYEELIFRQKGISVEAGRGVLNIVENIALGTRYRLVLLKQYYLPRQAYLTFEKDGNEVVFKPMIPLDFDESGAFNWGDISAFFTTLPQRI